MNELKIEFDFLWKKYNRNAGMVRHEKIEQYVGFLENAIMNEIARQTKNESIPTLPMPDKDGIINMN